MFLTLQDLKVDQTVIPSENSGIFITNINIPESEFGNINTIIERIRQLIVTDYVNIHPILFQVCATYQLRNTETNDIRQWTGSFNPRGNQANTLSPFQRFTPQFTAIVNNAISEDNVLRKLRFYHTATNWVFDKLTSFIICVQSEVQLNHPTLLLKGLRVTQNGKRTIHSFLLP